jgi:prepilin signal peptidase PulO-like enzyme (type II secretory pathway)
VIAIHGPTAAVAACLLAWTALGFMLAHAAERRSSSSAQPWPWRTGACALLLTPLALALRPLPEAAVCAVACIALVAASGPDYRTGYLFDGITFPTALLVTALAVATHATNAATWGVALLVVPFGALVFFTRGRMLGLGDVKAMYAVGAAFGPLESLVAIFAACVSGIVTVALAGRLKRGAELRFGPHLAAGSAFALVAGTPIARYLLGT